VKTQRLYMNVYRSGYYHRQGKPGHCNLHAGDFFTDEMEALRCAEPDKGYIETVAFDMPVPDGCVILANPEGCVPTPLHVTRDNPLALAPWHTAPEPPPPILTAGRACPTALASLDTSEADAFDPPRLIERHLTEP
jgi:hypothetical protein